MADGAYRFPELPARAMRKFALVIEPIRKTARKCGYAVAVHGSVARDIDLTARVIRMVKRLIGPGSRDIAKWHDRRGLPTEAYNRGRVSEPGKRGGTAPKPHGRRVWVLHLGGGPYIDLSVMPRRR